LTFDFLTYPTLSAFRKEFVYINQTLFNNFLHFSSFFMFKLFLNCPLESYFSEKFTNAIPTFTADSFTSFRFYFHDLRSLNVSQIPIIDGVTFIIIFGGGLDLFTGIAYLTLREFLEFICEVFVIAFIR